MIFIGRIFLFKKIRYPKKPRDNEFECVCAGSFIFFLVIFSGGHVNVANFCVFCWVFDLISASTMISANKIRRSSRIRNRTQPPCSPNQRRSLQIPFTPKTKYRNSFRNDDGILFLSKRKRSPPTAAELEARKRKKITIKTGQISLIALRHKVISLWEHDMHTNDLQFSPGSSKQIIL